MKLRVLGAVCLSVLAITWTSGCSAVTDKVTEKAAEKATESMIEKATGAKNIDIDKDGGSVKIKTDEGDMEIGAENGKIPDGFPSGFPIYDSAKVTSSIKANDSGVKGKSGYHVVFETTDDTAKVAAFYKSELVKSGYEISGTMELGDGTTSLTLKKGTDNPGNVMITKADGKTNIVVSITE